MVSADFASYRKRFGSRHTVAADTKAGFVLGVESVPDGLAAGLLAGVSPIYGLYGYLTGTLFGSLATGSLFMSIQVTGAMAVVVSDVPLTQSGDRVGPALATLSILTGLIMLALGLAKLGSLVRFIPTSVLIGFVNAVAINIVLVSWTTSPDTTARAATGSCAPWTLCCTPAASASTRSSSVPRRSA